MMSMQSLINAGILAVDEETGRIVRK
jgi:hypothetical protein